ncbi:hypothetical protein [Thermoactinospora rubra]|uniref:hypothetical protein n=1 Tax=Thermoactinospora rubra TaxID=1088767 RepID=UPI000A113DA4|nr:hypothetical protein [Thermoactinospora rubra]
MSLKDRQLAEILDALRERLPYARCRIRRFPEGGRFIRFTPPEGDTTLLFVEEDRWVCLKQGPSGLTSYGVVGRIGEPPRTVAGRLWSSAEVPSGRPKWRRLLRALAYGLVTAICVALLTAMLLAVLARSARYVPGADTYRLVLYAVSVVTGLAAGGWAARLTWRAFAPGHSGGGT